jgi:hypothetical protein
MLTSTAKYSAKENFSEEHKTPTVCMMHPADTSDDAVAATDGQPWKRSRRTDGHDTSVARTPVLMLAIRHEGLMIEKEESLLQGQNLVQAVVHPRNADEVVGALRTWHPRVLLVSGMHYGTLVSMCIMRRGMHEGCLMNVLQFVGAGCVGATGAGIPFATGHPPMSDDMLTAAIADAARVAPIEVVFLNCCTSWKLCQDLQSAHNIPVVVGWDGDAQTSHCIAVVRRP